MARAAWTVKNTYLVPLAVPTASTRCDPPIASGIEIVSAFAPSADVVVVVSVVVLDVVSYHLIATDSPATYPFSVAVRFDPTVPDVLERLNVGDTVNEALA
jgi:hypothetical protein